MQRIWERTYPYILTIISIWLYHHFIPSNFKNILETNVPNLATAIISLSGIFLSFVSAILSVLVSIKNTDMETILNETNAIKDLIRYIKECCMVSFISFVSCVCCLIIYSNGESGAEIYTEGIIIVLLLMTFLAYRVILILFAFTDVNSNCSLKNNLWGKKPYAPPKV